MKQSSIWEELLNGHGREKGFQTNIQGLYKDLERLYQNHLRFKQWEEGGNLNSSDSGLHHTIARSPIRRNWPSSSDWGGGGCTRWPSRPLIPVSSRSIIRDCNLQQTSLCLLSAHKYRTPRTAQGAIVLWPNINAILNR